eukprot:154085-Karenia_brevis.AAC.1
MMPPPVQPEPDPAFSQQLLAAQQLQWQVFQLMQQNQALQIAANTPKPAASKPMYASSILGKPIPEQR